MWDAPVRVTHWLMVASFAAAWLTAESERWRLLHVSAGYTLAGLVAFRIVWGLVGTRHARFASFVRGPAAVLAYLRGLLGGHGTHTPGHNPAGALAILALLGGSALLTASGWALYNELGGHALEELHEALANGLLALVGVHVAAVVVSSRLHRENLVRAMVDGRQSGAAGDAIRRPWRGVAAVVLAAVLGFWAWQWHSAPAADITAAHSQGDDD
ncbi:cytochrome b/b6 domain-containing protein [Ideonella sp. DXS22W]|uniref:Cytochrome b/b6 domain-containing protein n=1 Tax=Pseudaquabacterium inlustre TaxID=2984192 RepID=A0ABU9CGM4_9BURK